MFTMLESALGLDTEARSLDGETELWCVLGEWVGVGTLSSLSGSGRTSQGGDTHASGTERSWHGCLQVKGGGRWAGRVL